MKLSAAAVRIEVPTRSEQYTITLGNVPGRIWRSISINGAGTPMLRAACTSSVCFSAPTLQSRQHVDADTDNHRPQHREHGEQQGRHEALADQFRHRLVRLDRTPEIELHGLTEITRALCEQWEVDAHVGTHRGDVLLRRIRSRDQSRRMAGQQMHEQEDEGTDGQRHRNGASRPADQIVEQAPSRGRL